MRYSRALGQPYTINPAVYGEDPRDVRHHLDVPGIMDQVAATGESIAVPSQKGPDFWDVFMLDPAGTIKKLVVETTGGAGDAIAKAAAEAGASAGREAGDKVTDFLTKLTKDYGGYARVLFFVALGIAGLYIVGPIFAGGRR